MADQVLLSWPALLQGYALEISAAPFAEAHWSTCTNEVLLVGDQFVVSIKTAPSPAFFRLSKP
jgi:hypothetical protein